MITFNIRAFLLICLLLAGCRTERAVQRIPKEREKLHIFVLMGQSNMSGYGELEPEDTISVPHVFKIPTIGNGGELAWLPAAHPLHNRLKSDRFGLGVPFAQEYIKHTKGVDVGLIPLAWGGSEISRLNKGTDVYDDFLKKLVFAKKYGEVKGVLWHQGESDTVDETKASGYEGKLHQLIKDIRHDVGNNDLPFVVGNLAEFYGTSSEHNQYDRVKRIGKVKDALRALPSKVSKTAFVESTGCTSIDFHNVHFDRQSYMILGKRYYEAISSLR